ncbi:MAG TPA: DUF302 domain-containing protein [Steroidobacteraceae bacterium]|nr:DUF302 domain-containing protein [Steroidobacteraceae bacterium]
MSYYIAKTTDRPFDTVVDDTIGHLKAAGFGVLSDIDVQATIKSKIGAEMGRYRILGACNPQLAHSALKVEDKLGVLLPCNVIVREAADGRVEVAAIDPVSSLERTGNPALGAVAAEVRRRLAGVVEAVKA